MTDPLTPQQRSERMSRVHSTGSRSTEGRVEAALIANGIEGWVKQAKVGHAKPDFYFPAQRLAVFVDGCFWHACPVCSRRMPTARRDFWSNKIDQNRRRDNRQHRQLRREGYHVLRIWEHELKSDRWVKRLLAMLRRLDASRAAPNE